MIRTDEDDEFARIERENKMKGQPYHFEKREWVGLTDEDIAEIYNQKDWDIHTNWDYERAIEAKLKEKNT